jgi:hypothetical protein
MRLKHFALPTRVRNFLATTCPAKSRTGEEIMKNACGVAFCLGLALLAACTAADEQSMRIAVPEQNSLGVVAVEVDRFERDGQVFELRAFDATSAEVGKIRVRKGDIADLTAVDGNSYGAEIQVEVANAAERAITRNVNTIELRFGAAAIHELMSVPTVAAILEREEHVSLLAPGNGTLSGETALTASGCASNQLLVTPTAAKCCMDSGAIPAVTTFLLASGNLVQRVRNQNQPTTGCRSQTNGSCSGFNCYYGPFMYASPVQYTPPGGTQWSIYWDFWVDGWGNSDSFCGTSTAYNPPRYDYADVTGSQPRGGGCCINGSGPCDIPGKPLCTSCGGGGSAGKGLWDY